MWCLIVSAAAPTLWGRTSSPTALPAGAPLGVIRHWHDPDTYGTGKIPNKEICQESFHFRLVMILKRGNNGRFLKTATYGHFGRDNPEFTWETLKTPEWEKKKKRQLFIFWKRGKYLLRQISLLWSQIGSGKSFLWMLWLIVTKKVSFEKIDHKNYLILIINLFNINYKFI